MRIRRIRRLLENMPLKTVTVDVFDTVLLRKVYPEELQFYLHGKRASKILREQAELDVSPFAFVSLRQYVRKPIASERRHQGFDGEARLEEIFSLLLDFLLTGRERTMSDEEKHDIVDALIAEELALEKQLLRPNMRLVSLLRNFKDRGVRVYFLSDMYLSRDHIRELFVHFSIADLFEGGVTSSDLGYCKGSGRMFERILRGGVVGPFDPRTHVHIGDHVRADVSCANALACECLLLRGLHHTCYRPFVRAAGRMLFLFMRRHSSGMLRRSFHRELYGRVRALSPDRRTLFHLGFEVFGPPLLHYLSYLHASSLYGKRPIYFLSGEAPLLRHFVSLLFGECGESVHVLPSVNRIMALRAFAYLALTRTALCDARGILKLFWWWQGKDTVRDFVGSVGLSLEDWGLSELVLRGFDHEETVSVLAALCEKHSADRDRLLAPLARACAMVKNELNAAEFLLARRLIIADVGWHGSVQVLLEGISALLGWFPDVRGIYLGKILDSPFGLPRPKNVEGVIFTSLQEKCASSLFVSTIWEQILLRGRDGHLSPLIDGIEACFSYWKEMISSSPDSLLKETSRARVRFFSHPSKTEVRLLGPIEHDIGGGIRKFYPIVNTHLMRRAVWGLFFLKPAAFTRVYNAQYWQRGFLRWYGLHHFSWWGRCRTIQHRERERERAALLRELYDGPVDFAPIHAPPAVSARKAC